MTAAMLLGMANTTRQQSKPTPNRKPKQTHVAINVAIPVALHRKLRVKSINDELSLTEAVCAAIEAWTK